MPSKELVSVQYIIIHFKSVCRSVLELIDQHLNSIFSRESINFEQHPDVVLSQNRK